MALMWKTASPGGVRVILRCSSAATASSSAASLREALVEDGQHLCRGLARRADDVDVAELLVVGAVGGGERGGHLASTAARTPPAPRATIASTARSAPSRLSPRRCAGERGTLRASRPSRGSPQTRVRGGEDAVHVAEGALAPAICAAHAEEPQQARSAASASAPVKVSSRATRAAMRPAGLSLPKRRSRLTPPSG